MRVKALPIQRVRAKALTDTAAFAHIYEEHAPRIYAFIVYRVQDPAVAEDLTAAVFEKALEALPGFKPRDEQSWGAWLFRIARNEVGMYFRKHRPAEIYLSDDTPSGGDSPEVLAGEKEILARLRKEIARLAQREQEILALKFGAGFNNREIAKMMGMSESQVGTLLWRARKKLKERLGEYLEVS